MEPQVPAKLRARISNRYDLLPGVPQTSATGRRLRDLVTAYVSDLGGIENCSEVMVGLARRLAAITIQSELLEARMVNGERVDIPLLCGLASTVVRISSRLGLERRPRSIPGLHDRGGLLEQIAAEEKADA
jgi:hypothetical protein